MGNIRDRRGSRKNVIINLVNKWIESNWKLLDRMAREQLGERSGEGISEFYTWLLKTEREPSMKTFYYFLKNLQKPNSKINYVPISFRGGEEIDIQTDKPHEAVDAMIDIGDEEAVDFLLNNDNNEKWLRIYTIVYRSELKLNLFEKILFEYVFIKGMTIRDIVKITGNSQDYIYKQRRALIEKIKGEI